MLVYCLSFYMFFFAFTCLRYSLLFVYLSTCWPFFLFVHLFVFLSICLHDSLLFIYMSVCMPFFLYICHGSLFVLFSNLFLFCKINFTFFHNVFYAIYILQSFNNLISVVFCSFFEFGTVSKWWIRELVKTTGPPWWPNGWSVHPVSGRSSVRSAAATDQSL